MRVGAENGIIYELVNAKTLGEAASSEPDRVEEYATRMAELLVKFHSTHFERGQLPDARNILFGWIDIAERSDLYTPDTIELLRQSVAGIEDADRQTPLKAPPLWEAGGRRAEPRLKARTGASPPAGKAIRKPVQLLPTLTYTDLLLPAQVVVL